MDFKTKKSKFTADYNSRDTYRFFKRYTSLYNNKEDKIIPEIIFTKVFKIFSERVIHEIINNFFYFKMPYNLGGLFIHSYKKKYTTNEDGSLQIKNNMIDVVSTRELWKSDNEAKKNKTLIIKDYSNTDDIIYKIRWSKINAKFVNNKFYAFKPSRIFKTKIYQSCIDGTITNYN
jgi:hypothetical protein